MNSGQAACVLFPSSSGGSNGVDNPGFCHEVVLPVRNSVVWDVRRLGPRHPGPKGAGRGVHSVGGYRNSTEYLVVGAGVLLASPARAPSRVWIGPHSTKMVPAPHFLSGPRRSEQRGFLFAAETAGIREGSREPRGVMQPLDALEAGYSRPKMRPAYV